MSEQQHSPLPFSVRKQVTDNGAEWFDLVDAEGCFVADIDTQESADLILRACNSHYALLEALKELMAVLSDHQIVPIASPLRDCSASHGVRLRRAVDAAEAAIQKAEA